MFVFDTNGRVQKVAEGIQFYEQDILCSSYSFSGDQRIELSIDYVRPGFGIAIIEESKSAPTTADTNAYLFKIGINDFRVYEKLLGRQSQTYSVSCRLAPVARDVKLVFVMKDKKVYLTAYYKSQEIRLGEYTITKKFEQYRIGFYSNAGNTIRSLTFLESIPRHWRTSTVNTIGGRISFEKDTLRIENCEKEAEVIQEAIPLKPGRYWLRYKKEDIDGVNDIRAFVFPSQLADETEENLEDEYKDMLDEDGSFLVNVPMDITLKFKGHAGIVQEISLTDDDHSDFIETEGEQACEEGSEIRIKLTSLERVEWKTKIDSIPPWEDLIQDCPYAVISTKLHPYSVEDLSLSLGKYFNYKYFVDSKRLVITNEKEELVFDSPIVFSAGDNNVLVIMKNVTSSVSMLQLIPKEGNSVDVVIQKTFKRYVPDTIDSPIVVTKKGSKEPFDLSASYREIVDPQKKIILFGKGQLLRLKEEIPVNAHFVTIYGIPKGVKINTSATDIKEFATAYAQIPRENYSFSGSYFTVKDSVRELYEYLAVEYDSIDDYSYEFTNYERETFDGSLMTFTFEKPVSKDNEDIMLYGIPYGTNIHEEYLYRVPNGAMINSIDYYTDNYEELSMDMYEINYVMGQLKIKPTAKGKYQRFVIDYLKSDSYCINHRMANGQYEVDIATDAKQVDVHYDMREDGGTYKYVRTNIRGDENNYVVLRRKELQ